jgi:ABC-type lipoprotein export system ATPase subunit
MNDFIRLDRVYKIHQVATTGVAALGGVSLRISEGDFTAIVGPSGAGKSSILNLIGGVDVATAGTVWVGGRDVQLFDDRERSAFRRERIGFLWQGAAKNLVPYLSAAQNVELPLILAGAGVLQARRRAVELLERLGLEGRAAARPQALSGGEQQRVALAVALANEPLIVLADEPTAEIDTHGAEIVVQLLRDTSRELGTTVVMATHDLVAAAAADTTYRLIDGRLRGPGGRTDVDVVGRLTLPPQAGERGFLDLTLEVEFEADEVRLRRIEEPVRGEQPTYVREADAAGSDEVVLSATGVGRTYPGAVPVPALVDVSLTLSPGELVVLMGPSGSGKSTLLGLLAGLDQPDEGEIRWGSRLLADIDESEMARLRATNVGVIFQGFGLFPSLSALENVVLPLLMAGIRPGTATETATGWLERFGLGGRLDHRVNELSVGQQQRVAVARGIANGQRVVLADEPTAELDERSAGAVLEALHAVALGGGAVIIATHDPWVLQRADRALIMRDGRIEAAGPPGQMVDRVSTD